MSSFIKNLKYSTVEVTERVYVDQPMKKQKEVPIERKQGVANSLIKENMLGKVNLVSKDIYQKPTQISNQPS